LALEGISARVVRGLFLEDGRRRQSLTNFVEIHDGQKWILFDQDTGRSGKPGNFLIWQRGGQSLLDVIGGKNSQVSFSIIKNIHSTRNLVVNSGMHAQAGLIDFSIYSLPIEQQTAFKMILLLPIGALIVVIMRILVGIRTSGTFMPILIALALIQTTLITGIVIFLIVVSTGLLIRSYLSRLNLLLVARISAVIIVVITIIASISIISHKLGLSQALQVTFFPMIILAWTIERMSVLWEEDGPREVFIQGAGSLLTAVIAYLFMTNRTVEYLTFNFPELMLVNLALILILGQYTGYRLTELYRFHSMGRHHASDKR
ncbi:MAG TPA: 7TM domain-containing protein, partial [Nitrosomonas sp.]|nr:7TM domain-containing protein [Nitrosomonas sp.]